MQAHPASARLPFRPRAVAAKSRELAPRLSAIGRAEQSGVFDAGVGGVRVSERWLQMPDSLELPRALRAVIPLMRGERFAGFGRRVVDELVALAPGHSVRSGGRLSRRCSGLMPCLAAVVRALNDLPKPAAGLRRVNPIRVNRRAFYMIDLPAREVRAADAPTLSLCVRSQDECALARTDQCSYPAHPSLLPNCAATVHRH